MVSRDLRFPGNVSHSLLSPGFHITVGLETFFPSCYLLSFGSLFDWLPPSSPPFPLLIRYLLASLLGAVSDMQNESVILSLLFFSCQQNVSQRVVMEVSVCDRTSASVKKAILVLSVNKWTETSAE